METGNHQSVRQESNEKRRPGGWGTRKGGGKLGNQGVETWGV